jgi:phosphate acyltransferase
MRPRVALDAMGGDHAPAVPVAVVAALQGSSDVELVLVGDEHAIRNEWSTQGNEPGWLSARIVDAPETVSMEDEAVASVRRKRRASIPVGLTLVKDGDADAFVSAGNTGAVTAAAIFVLGRLEGVDRPVIGIQFPTLSGEQTLLIDAGAVTDPRPHHVLQQARLASRYVAETKGIARPRVGLLSNGEESGKGNQLTRESHALMASDEELNFVGNIEGNGIPAGLCDVLVTDGFTGNVALKTAEGVIGLLQAYLREELTRSFPRRVLAALLRPAFRAAGKRLDYREFGGAPLLGVKGLVYIAHGSSDEKALTNAVLAAAEAVRSSVMERLASPLD